MKKFGDYTATRVKPNLWRGDRGDETVCWLRPKEVDGWMARAVACDLQDAEIRAQEREILREQAEARAARRAERKAQRGEQLSLF